jgi:hypothetical protein
MMANRATPFDSTQDSNQGIGFTASALNSGFKNSNLSATDKVTQQRDLNHCFRRQSTIHNFYTKASILMPRAIVSFEQVQVDRRSLSNLLPLSIAMNLGLVLYPYKILIADRSIQTNQFCRFTIRVAGIDATINANVISGLQTIVLGREWIQSVNLLSDIGNQNYYIPIPLAIEPAEEKLPNVNNARVEAGDSREFEKCKECEEYKEYKECEVCKMYKKCEECECKECYCEGCEECGEW